MMGLLSLFDLAKLARIGVIAAGCLSAWGVWIWNHDSKVVKNERARVEAKSNANAQKAKNARDSVDRVPADRLRDKYCRDC